MKSMDEEVTRKVPRGVTTAGPWIGCRERNCSVTDCQGVIEDGARPCLCRIQDRHLVDGHSYGPLWLIRARDAALAVDGIVIPGLDLDTPAAGQPLATCADVVLIAFSGQSAFTELR